MTAWGSICRCGATTARAGTAWSGCANESRCWAGPSRSVGGLVGAPAWSRGSRRGKGEAMADQRISVVLIEDHGVVRDGLRLILEQLEDIELVAVEADGRDG